MESAWWLGIIGTFLVGVILLILEYRTKWFARWRESLRSKRDSASKVVNFTVQAPGQNSSASIQEVTTYQVEGNLVINPSGQVAVAQSAGAPTEAEIRHCLEVRWAAWEKVMVAYKDAFYLLQMDRRSPVNRDKFRKACDAISDLGDYLAFNGVYLSADLRSAFRDTLGNLFLFVKTCEGAVVTGGPWEQVTNDFNKVQSAVDNLEKMIQQRSSSEQVK